MRGSATCWTKLDQTTQPPLAHTDTTRMLSTCPLRVALWLCALARADITPELVACAARLLDARHQRWRSWLSERCGILLLGLAHGPYRRGDIRRSIRRRA